MKKYRRQFAIQFLDQVLTHPKEFSTIQQLQVKDVYRLVGLRLILGIFSIQI